VLRDLKKKTQIYEKGVSGSVLTSCALEQNNTRLLACGGLDTRIYVFAINRKEEPGKMTKSTELTGHAGLVTCCNFLDENFLISGSNDSTLILWDISKEGKVREFVDHESEITCMDVCEEDGNLLVSGSDDTTVRVWDVRMKEPCTRVFEESKSSINIVKFMPARYFNLNILVKLH
jgi:WD40 repeat protein